MNKPKLRLIITSLFLLIFGLSLFHASSVSAQVNESVRVITLSASGFEQAHSVVFSSDGKILAVGGTSGIYLFDPWKLSALDFISANTWAHSVVFQPDSNNIAAGLFDGTIKFWSLPGKNLTKTLTGPQGWVRSISFSGDGKLVASASDDNTVRVWNVADDTSHLVLDTNTTGVRAVALSPDGKLVAAALEDKTVRIWRVANGELTDTLNGHTDWVRCMAFSPDGKLLASGGFDKTVRLWNVSDGALLQTLKGHTSSVLGVAFSPDGKMVASGSVDQTVHLWRVSDGASLNILLGHKDFVYTVAFSPDGKTLASGSADNTVRLWNVQNFPTDSAANIAQQPAAPSDCRVCHHSRGLSQPPRVMELRCEGCHVNGASLKWCPAFSRSPDAVTPPVSYKLYSGQAGVPIGGSDLSVLIASPSNGETLYVRDGITAPAYVVGQIHSANPAVTEVQVQLTVWSGNQNTATLTTTPSPTGQFKFNLSIDPQGGIAYINKPVFADCVPCHEDYVAQAALPNGDVKLMVAVSDGNGLQASDERWINVDVSKTSTVPVEVIDAITHQPLPGLPIQARAVLYEWRSRFGNAVTQQNGVAQIMLNQLSQAPTHYTVSIPPTVYHGKLYSSDQSVPLTLTPDKTSYPTLTLIARTQTGQLAGKVTGANQTGALDGTKIWAVQLPAGPAYSAALDAQDGFSFPQIPVSQYVVLPDPLSLSQHGLSAAEQNIDLIHSPQSNTTFNLIKDNSISGIVSANGVSLPFAWLTVGGNSEASAVDPASGSFLISELPSDAGYLTVSAPGYYSLTQHINNASQSQDFQLVARPETQRVNWGSGYLIVPPETESAIKDFSISLGRGWLWGEGGASQPLTITLPNGQVIIRNADFALEYPVDDTGWLYIRKGSAQVILNGDQTPVEVGSGQMIALVSGAQPIPSERIVVMALHPKLAEAPIPEIVEPTLGAKVQTWLEKAGIGVAQAVTFITYILSLVTLFTIPLLVLFLYWKKRRNSSSSEEKL